MVKICLVEFCLDALETTERFSSVFKAAFTLLPGAPLLTAVSAWAEGEIQGPGNWALRLIVHLCHGDVVTAVRAQLNKHPFSLLVLR